MRSEEAPPPVRIVLVGVGHTHAEVVRRWRARPVDRAELTCVSTGLTASYSGMLPGVLAGQYRPQDMNIDVSRLCAASSARLVIGQAGHLDLIGRTLSVNGSPVPFDVLSIGIGSVPSTAGVEIDSDAPYVPVKPMQSFLDRLGATLRQAANGTRRHPRVAVVGGGAGGVEVALTLPAYVRSVLGQGVPGDVMLLAGANGLEPGRLSSTRRRVQRALARAGIEVISGHRVVRICRRHLVLDDARAIDADLVVWVTGASAPPWLATLGLPTDARGFLLTDACLQTTAGAPVFAVGDSGTIAGSPTPKAGVYAVRHGPVLWDNLQRALAGAPLRPYEPQPGFLKLLNTGDGRAIGEWKDWSFEGRWCWRLKDRIDRRFASAYQAS